MDAYEFLAQEFENGILNREPPFFMQGAIFDTPDCLAACLDHSIRTSIRSFLRANSFSNVFLIGCGTSLNAGKLAAYAFRDWLKRPSFAVNALEFSTNPPLEFTANSLAIFASHSGTTGATCLAQEKAREAGARTIAIVGAPNTALTEKADLVLVDPYGIENVFGKTRSFLSTAFLAMLIAIEALPNPKRDNEIQLAKEMISILHENLPTWEKQAKRLSKSWAQQKKWYLMVGMGALSVVANEIALKAIEVLTEPANGFDLEESLHGPTAAYFPETGIFLFQTDHNVVWRAQNVDSAVHVTSASDLVITTTPREKWNPQAEYFGIPDMDSLWAAFPCALIADLVIYHLGVAKGICTDVNGQDRNPDTIKCRPFIKFIPPA